MFKSLVDIEVLDWLGTHEIFIYCIHQEGYASCYG